VSEELTQEFGDIKLGIRFPRDFVEWLRAKCLEEYGTTYGKMREVIIKSCQEWFIRIEKGPLTAQQQHHHLFTVKKAPRRRDVQRKLKQITAELRPRGKVNTVELTSLIDRICGQNGGLADTRTRQTYIDYLMVGCYGLKLVPDQALRTAEDERLGLTLFRVDVEQTGLNGFSPSPVQGEVGVVGAISANSANAR
jgi:hypothetical protein